MCASSKELSAVKQKEGRVEGKEDQEVAGAVEGFRLYSKCGMRRALEGLNR